MADSLKSLDTKIENKSAFSLTMLVGTSLLRAAFPISRDSIFFKMMPDEKSSNKFFLLLSKDS